MRRAGANGLLRISYSTMNLNGIEYLVTGDIVNYQTTKSVVSKIINDEFIVIHLDTGRYHYFNKETEKFLKAFQGGCSLEQYVSQNELDASEKAHLQALCDKLLERKIFEKSGNASKTPELPLNYDRPTFLRDGEKTLDQISFLSP